MCAQVERYKVQESGMERFVESVSTIKNLLGPVSFLRGQGHLPSSLTTGFQSLGLYIVEEENWLP